MNERINEIQNISFRKKLFYFVVLLAIYFVVSLPFKAMTVIPGFTDIRPVTMLQPIYGIFYGVPGSIVVGIGNLISDILSDSLRWSSIAGFAANFLGPFIFYIFWTRLSKTPFHLRSGKNISKYIVLCIFIGLLEAVIITPFVAMIYPDVDYKTFGLIVFFNSALFPVLLGIPIMILMQEELGFRPLRSKKQMLRSESAEGAARKEGDEAPDGEINDKAQNGESIDNGQIK